MTATKNFLSIGEAMIELAPTADNLYKRGFAGDTLNTAWYLRACLSDQWRVSFVTKVGDDALSREMTAFMASNGIHTDAVEYLANRSCGLYMISLHNGERSFSYWRENSPARELAADADFLKRVCADADRVFLSGVTLAILPEPDRHTLIQALKDYSNRGGEIHFDPNYRPALWEDINRCRHSIEQLAALSAVVLPSFDDEQHLFADATPHDTCARYLSYGANEVVVKNSNHPVTYGEATGNSNQIATYPLPSVIQPKDSTGAGDSFNGAYLAARVIGFSPQEAIHKAAWLSSKVIGHEGALIEMSHCISLVSEYGSYWNAGDAPC